MKIVVIYFDYFPKSLKNRVKEYNIKGEIIKSDEISSLQYIPDIIIISGSSKRILRDNYFPKVFDLIRNNKTFTIGICFGFHLMSFLAGGEIIECEQHKKNEKISENLILYFNHNDRVVNLPKDWKIVDKFSNFINIATSKNMIGFQFHPERNKKSFELFLLPFLQL